MRQIATLALTLCLATCLTACLAAGAARAADLPEPVADRIAGAPDRFLRDAADVIHGYGGPDGLDRSGAEAHVAITRAEARAREMRRFLEADLDADGRVTAAEVRTLSAARSADQRARLATMVKAADANADGTVDPAEVSAAAGRAAQKAMSDDEAARVMAILAMDGDADGRVTLAEVEAAVQALVQSRAPASGAGKGTATEEDA